MKYNLKVFFSLLLIFLSVIYFDNEKYPMLILTIGGVVLINIKMYIDFLRRKK